MEPRLNLKSLLNPHSKTHAWNFTFIVQQISPQSLIRLRSVLLHLHSRSTPNSSKVLIFLKKTNSLSSSCWYIFSWVSVICEEDSIFDCVFFWGVKFSFVSMCVWPVAFFLVSFIFFHFIFVFVIIFCVSWVPWNYYLDIQIFYSFVWSAFHGNLVFLFVCCSWISI